MIKNEQLVDNPHDLILSLVDMGSIDVLDILKACVKEMSDAECKRVLGSLCLPDTCETHEDEEVEETEEVEMKEEPAETEPVDENPEEVEEVEVEDEEEFESRKRRLESRIKRLEACMNRKEACRRSARKPMEEEELDDLDDYSELEIEEDECWDDDCWDDEDDWREEAKARRLEAKLRRLERALRRRCERRHCR